MAVGSLFYILTTIACYVNLRKYLSYKALQAVIITKIVTMEGLLVMVIFFINNQ